MQMKYKDYLPNFLGIGAHRAGTTWLWRWLKHHPDIWMPPVKEIHYFDRRPVYPSPSFLASEWPFSRLFGQKHHNVFYRKLLLSRLRQDLKHPDWKQIRWDLRYFFGRVNDNWYASLFKDGKDRVRGEITPAYSILNGEDVEYISGLIPNLKIIFIMRNPIARAWSNVRYDGFNTSNSIDKIKKFIDSPGQTLRSDYVGIIKMWKSCFPEDQFFVGFYDDLVQDPKIQLFNTLKFLGLDASRMKIPNHINRSINSSSTETEIPTELKLYLAQKYYNQIQQLNDSVGGNTAVWLAEAENILSGQNSSGPKTNLPKKIQVKKTPNQSYIVCTTPRSGSTVLCNILSNTKVAGQPTEYFYEGDFYNKLWEKWEVSNFSEYLQSVFQETATPNGVIGVKIMTGSGYFTGFMQNIRKIPRYQTDSRTDWEILSDLFPNLHYIWLTRRNKVRQAVSQWRALQSGVWHQYKDGLVSEENEINFNFEEIDLLVQNLVLREVAWQDYFTAAKISPLTIVYEDFVQSPQEIILQILSYLNVSAPSNWVLKMNLKKLTDFQSEMWVKQYLELKKGCGQA